MKKSSLLNERLWEVSTEGDIEGRSIKNIGIFMGNLLEIAKRLRGMPVYQLYFKEIKPSEYPSLSESSTSRKEVNFSVAGFSKEELLKELQDHNIEPSNFYKAVKLTFSEEELIDLKRQRALAKLTEEELKLLNLTK